MSVKFDTREVDAALKKGLNVQDMLAIEGAGAKTIINAQRLKVPKDTHATELSIREHYEEVTKMRVVDDIGPETTYAPSIEFGITSKPNYPIQPFVRPSVFGSNRTLVEKVISTAFKLVIEKKYG